MDTEEGVTLDFLTSAIDYSHAWQTFSYWMIGCAVAVLIAGFTLIGVAVKQDKNTMGKIGSIVAFAGLMFAMFAGMAASSQSINESQTYREWFERTKDAQIAEIETVTGEFDSESRETFIDGAMHKAYVIRATGKDHIARVCTVVPDEVTPGEISFIQVKECNRAVTD